MADQETCVLSGDPTIATRYRLELVREHGPPYEALQPCNRPERAAEFLAELVRPFAYEVMGVVMLDTRNRAIGHLIAYQGTLNRAAVEPRGLLVPSLLANAAGIIVFHNHPSGDPSPSAEDLAFTRRLAAAGDTVGIKLVDHLILGAGDDRWVSLKQRGSF
ncbi:MAG: JAB domain-containing protein [Acidobacteria bacterium]|nr:JAB domain-containing protein [Acidobacteriota bacterium]